MKKSLKIPRPVSIALKFSVSVGFVWWLVYEVAWADVLARFRDAEITLLAAYVALLIVSIGISSRKWQLIVRFKGFECGWWEAYRIYLTGMFVNNFLPSIIGGDTYRGLWLIRRDGRYREAVSTLIFDRFTGLWAAMVFSVIFSVWHWRLMIVEPLWIGLLVVIVASLLFDAILPVLRRWLLFQRIILMLPGRVGRMIDELAGYTRREMLVPVLGLALLFNVVGVALANYLLFEALGNSIPFTQFAAVIFLVSIVSSIPVSINNIGIKEWAYFTFFGFVGGNPEAAVAVALVSRFVQMFLSFFALPTYVRAVRHLSFPDVSDSEEEHEEESTPSSHPRIG